jgi:hypothetical protein
LPARAALRGPLKPLENGVGHVRLGAFVTAQRSFVGPRALSTGKGQIRFKKALAVKCRAFDSKNSLLTWNPLKEAELFGQGLLYMGSLWSK